MRAAVTEIALVAIEELPAIVSLTLFVGMLIVWARIITHGI